MAATFEPFDFASKCVARSLDYAGSVWYSYTATADARLIAESGGIAVGVIEGTEWPNIRPMGCGGPVVLDVLAHRTYMIQLLLDVGQIGPYTITFTLAHVGSISGRVKTNLGDTVQCDDITTVVGPTTRSTRGSSNGRYSLRDLAPGDYEIWFRQCSGSPFGEAPKVFVRLLDGAKIRSADSVVVIPPKPHPYFDLGVENVELTRSGDVETNFTVTMKIRNRGVETAREAALYLFVCPGESARASRFLGCRQVNQDYFDVRPGESLSRSYSFCLVGFGDLAVLVEVGAEGTDLDRDNNESRTAFSMVGSGHRFGYPVGC